MCKWIDTQSKINPVITGSISSEAKLNLWDKRHISFLATACGNLLEWLLEYEWFKSDFWTSTWIGAGFEQRLLLLHVYVLCPIYVELTIYPNDTDEPYEEVIITILPIWICSLLKYESVTHHYTMNIL